MGSILNGSVLNNYMFRPPKCTYEADSFPNDLIFIPKDFEAYDSRTFEATSENSIPCLLLSPVKRRVDSVRLLMMYMHANAEDLKQTYHLAKLISQQLLCHVIVPEYPGYGIFSGEPSEKSVNEVCKTLYRFITERKGFNWPSSNLIVCGRSIGSGPACFLASEPQKRKKKLLHRDYEKRNSLILPFYNCTVFDVDKNLIQLILKAENILYEVSENIEHLQQRIMDHNIDVRDFETHYDLICRDSLKQILKSEKIKVPNDCSRKEMLEIIVKKNLFGSSYRAEITDSSRCGLLVLISSFESISQLVGKYAGTIAKKIVPNRFNNIKLIKTVTAPVTFLNLETSLRILRIQCS